MDSIKQINLNNLYNNKLTYNKYQQLYSIDLEKDKYYFIDLVSKDDYEFNLRIYDSNKNKININSNSDCSSHKPFDIFKDNNEFINYKSNVTPKAFETGHLESLEKDKSKQRFVEDDYMDEDDDYIDDDNNDDDDDDDDDEDDDDDDDDYDDDDENDDYYDDDDDDDDDKKYEVGEKTMKLVIYENPDDPNDKIELIIEFIAPKQDTSKYYNNITKIINNQKIIDYNNKIYFSPDVTDKYLISVNSDYKGEGEYSFIIKEVEDVSISLDKKLILNENTIIKFRKKLVSQKFVINLDINKTYNLSSKNHGLKIFIFGEGKIYSNENNLDITFTTILGDKYLIDIIPINNNHTNIIKLTEIEELLNNKKKSHARLGVHGPGMWNPSLSTDIASGEQSLDNLSTNIIDNNLYVNNIIMKDKLNDDEYSLHIENGKLITLKINI